MVAVRVSVTDTFTPKARNAAKREQMRYTAMEATLALLQGTVMPLTPVGVTSFLRGSWHHDRPDVSGTRVMGVMGSSLTYSEIMERGRTPGAKAPPVSAIQTWVERKLGADVSAFVVARSIGRKGIKGRRMLELTISRTESARRNIWDNLARTMLEQS